MTDIRIALNHPSFDGPNGWTPMLTPERARRAILALPFGEAKNCKVRPNRLPVGDDFRDYATAQALGALGFFALDLPTKRRQFAIEREIEALIEDAYDVAGFCRRATYVHIADNTPSPPGVWAHSTAAFGDAVRKADSEVLALSPAILETYAALVEEHQRIVWGLN